MLGNAVALAIVAVQVVSAQTFPSSAAIEAGGDASTLLTRARAQILDSIRRMPKYTCLQTIDRKYYVPSVKERVLRGTYESPRQACVGNRSDPMSLDATDRLRIEVAESSEGEIHSWPGASRFDTRSIDQVIPFGPASSGSFGAYLRDIFDNPGAQVRFIGRNAKPSGTVFAYSFHVPRKASHSFVKTRRGWTTTGNSGSFEIDAATAELARVVIETDPLSPDTGMCQATTTIDYQLLLMGDGKFLIPRRSELQTVNVDNSRTDSAAEFSACREYTAESTIRFDDQKTATFPIHTPPQRTSAFPPGVTLTLALLDGIDLSTAAAGDPISAKVVDCVGIDGSKQVRVPTDAIARGRIVQIRHEFSTSEFVIALRFNRLEMGGVVSPFAVRLDRKLEAERRTPRGLAARGTEFSLSKSAPMVPENLLVFPATSGAYRIPAGFESKWITLKP